MPRRSLLVVVAAVLLLILQFGWETFQTPSAGRSADSQVLPAGKNTDADIDRLIQIQAKETWVEITGSVSRLLPDDREGSAHQRFILRLASGRTLLVAHNIDLARRVPLQAGDTVRLRGRYEWNDKGGVIHWTHHDPGKRQPGGWIEHSTVRYQ
jgi:hypothetical protein